jgi:hypothetical protein
MFLVIIQKNKLYMKNKYKSLKKQIAVLAVLVLSTIGTSWAQVYCTAGATIDPPEEFIADVQFPGFSNPSGSVAGGYSDYTSLIIPMTMGTDYLGTIVNGASFNASEQCGVWVDWNQDGDFDDIDETMPVTGSPSVGPFGVTINPPLTALGGLTRMRIRHTWVGDVLPCGTTTFGEVEDIHH